MQTLLVRAAGVPIDAVVHEDNAQVVSAVARGYSPALKHLARHLRLSIGFLEEFFADSKGQRQWGSARLVKVPSADQKADVFTKALAPPMFVKACEMIMMRRNGQTSPENDDEGDE